MAKSRALSFSLSSLSPSVSLSRETQSPPHKVSYLRRSSPRGVCYSGRGKSGFSGDDDDPFGLYPWNSSHGGDFIEWIPEETITLFTSDGLIQIGGSAVPRRIPASQKQQGKLKSFRRLQRYQESDYMDPNQSLCLGALFYIAATNGLDMGRRLCIFGFCRSIEMLSDVVEDTVLEQGGEIVAAEKASDGNLHEKLTMSVAVPRLWGVPPASETLHFAVRSGGGIVEKIYRFQVSFSVQLLGYL